MATSIPFSLITSSAPAPPNVLTKTAKPFISRGQSFIMLELGHAIRLKNLVIRNSGTPFLTVLGGIESDINSIKANITNQNIINNVLNSLSVIVPETQLLSLEQYIGRNPADEQKRNKVRTFRQFNKYVCNNKSQWKLLVFICREFKDLPGSNCGLSWIEVFGEIVKPGEIIPDNLEEKLDNSQSFSFSLTASQSIFQQSQPRPSQPNTFLSPSNKNNNISNNTQSTPLSSQSTNSNDSNSIPLCNFNFPCVGRIIRKPGPDQNKLNYVCAQKDNPCNFSILADDWIKKQRQNDLMSE